jgi:hypothetical protein
MWPWEQAASIGTATVGRRKRAFCRRELINPIEIINLPTLSKHLPRIPFVRNSIQFYKL